jgi:RNA polymerase sigma-70 factor, ECF subfamily
VVCPHVLLHRLGIVTCFSLVAVPGHADPFPTDSHLQLSGSRAPIGGVRDPGTDELVGRIEALYRTDGKKMWRSIFAFTGDPEVTDDAIAEAFAQALARGDAIRDPAAWVWRVAFLAAGRERERRGTLVELAETGIYELPEPISEVMQALGSLSPNQRLAVVMHDYGDRPTDEIAALIGASRQTVHSHLSKGRKRLRALLGDDDVQER